MDYGPAVPPRLGSDLHNASDQNTKKASDRHKNTLTKGMTLTRGPPRINTMMNPMNLGFHFLNPKNMLTRVDIRSGPGTCHPLQRRISPL